MFIIHNEQMNTLSENKIKKYSNSIINPINELYQNIDSHSWFDIKEHTIYDDLNDFNIKQNEQQLLKINDKSINSIQIKIYPTKKQKEILIIWMNAFIKMYNETLRFIKHNKNIKINFYDLRKNHLYEMKKNIEKETILNGNSKTKICTHILDEAIDLVCASYKSAHTNLKLGNIKYFKIKYWNLNKNIKILKIEKSFFNDNGFCATALGKKIKRSQKYDFKNINSTCTLIYNKNKDTFTLFTTQNIEKKENQNQKYYISNDPGTSTFMNAISDNKVIKIATNTNRISKLIKKIDEIKILKKMANKPTKKSKQKKIIKLENKITNMVDDLHWKTINYMTKTYKNILVGDVSSKKISSKYNKGIGKMTKRLA